MVRPARPVLPLGAPRAERADAVRNRRHLLATARAMLAEQGGTEGLTMDALAERARLGKGTVFRRFGTRSGIFQALLDDDEVAFQQDVIAGPPPLGPGADPRERLIAYGRARIAFLLGHREIARAALDASCKYPWPRRPGQQKFGWYADDAEVFAWLRADAPADTPTRRCLEANKHVLCEIPLATSLADAEALTALADQRERRLMVCHTQRYFPALVEAKRLVADGQLHPHAIVSRYMFFRRSNTNWVGRTRSWTDNLIWHHGCHAVDAALWLLGADSVEVVTQVALPGSNRHRIRPRTGVSPSIRTIAPPERINSATWVARSSE